MVYVDDLIKTCKTFLKISHHLRALCVFASLHCEIKVTRVTAYRSVLGKAFQDFTNGHSNVFVYKYDINC